MTRSEFIAWLETSSFSRDNHLFDGCWRELVDYADYTFDYVDVEEDHVIFSWERKYWGGTDNERDKYSFEEFIERYNNYTLKH